MVAMSQTVIDNFNDNSVNGTIWTNWGGVSETNQRIEATITTVQFDFKGMDYIPTVDVDEVWYGMQAIDAGQQASLGYYPALINIGTPNHSFYWFILNGTAEAWINDNLNFQQISTMPYVPATHVYFAVGINALGQLDWRWSTDGSEFTSLTTLANPFGATSPGIFTFQAGRDPAGGTAHTCMWDNFSSWVETAAGLSIPVAQYNYRRRRTN